MMKQQQENNPGVFTNSSLTTKKSKFGFFKKIKIVLSCDFSYVKKDMKKKTLRKNYNTLFGKLNFRKNKSTNYEKYEKFCELF